MAFEGLGMPSLPVAGHPTTVDAFADNHYITNRRAAATVFPADIEDADALNIDKTDVIALFRKRKYKGTSVLELRRTS